MKLINMGSFRCRTIFHSIIFKLTMVINTQNTNKYSKQQSSHPSFSVHKNALRTWQHIRSEEVYPRKRGKNVQFVSSLYTVAEFIALFAAIFVPVSYNSIHHPASMVPPLLSSGGDSEYGMYTVHCTVLVRCSYLYSYDDAFGTESS